MHLGKYSTFLFAQGILAATLLGGCIIVGTGSSGGSGSGGVGGGFDTSSDTGVGGEYENTTVGYETTVTTTTTTGTGPSCVGVNGNGKVSDCDNLNIAPASGASSICGPAMNEAPLGYGACKHAFSVYTTGAATDFLVCLSNIGVENACNDSLVSACIDSMYKDVCYDKQIEDSCIALDDDCVKAGQGNIDRAQCTKELTPLSDAAIGTLDGCITEERNKAGATCKAAYDTCYENLLSF